MKRSRNNPWLHRFAVFTGITVLMLIGLGGVVTSHGVGMAVPDWPTTYGYNMFLFPISLWQGGIFYEHTHRLFASFVGLLTTILAVWLWLKEERRWLRWLGVAAFFGVVFQGVLGGLRVTLFKDELGIFHATLAQLFLVLIAGIALFTSRWWSASRPELAAVRLPSKAGPALAAGTALIFLQLVLGATMRHQHAGLAVPDFPLAYGQLWPSTDAAFLETVNRQRTDVREFNPITAFQVHLHMAHRLGGILILLVITYFAWQIRGRLGKKALLSRLATGWFALIAGQFLLGVMTVLSNKAADVATGHVVLGAVSLVMGALLCMTMFLPMNHESGTSARAGRPLRTDSSDSRPVLV